MTGADGRASDGLPAVAAEDDDAEYAGAGIVTASWGVTGVFVALTVIAVVLPDAAADLVAAVDVALFAGGLVAFLWAYGVAVQRSRTDEVSIGGSYFLAGDVAPAVVRTRLRLALGIQIVGAIAAASIRPFTSVAFAVLVPMLGLGLQGLWGARHGVFPPRAER